MHLFVNALSIGSLSGAHVVYGFLRPMCRWFQPQHQLTILHYEGQSPPLEILQAGVKSIALPKSLGNWFRRTAWELAHLPKVLQDNRADVLLGVSGAINPRCPVPQVTLAQNPWCYVAAAQQGWKDRLKAGLQRSGYRSAFRKSAMMVYISSHLRDLYRQANSDANETRSEIAYVGLNDDTYRAATELRGSQREEFSVLSVSAFAPWKGVESVVEAISLLRARGIPAKLKLVGPWPVPEYESRVRKLIADRQLDQTVQIVGKVSTEELHRFYASSQVFCLMSSCESFGIPAAEAMAFGTPIVSTDCCAIAEVCAGSGLFGPINDAPWTANALERALTNKLEWETWSDSAVTNASKLTWEQCAAPFRTIPDLVCSAAS